MIFALLLLFCWLNSELSLPFAVFILQDKLRKDKDLIWTSLKSHVISFITTEMMQPVIIASIMPSAQTRQCTDVLLIVSRCSLRSGPFHKGSDKCCFLHQRRWRNRCDGPNRFTLCCLCGRGRHTKRSGDITRRLIGDTSRGCQLSPAHGRPRTQHSHAKQTPTWKKINKQHAKWHLVPTTASYNSSNCLGCVCVWRCSQNGLGFDEQFREMRKYWKLWQKFSVSSHLAQSQQQLPVVTR